ncbi:MAG: hypothetical protein SVK54_03395, partial [candidate division WOR-3 bacterium]|nr:hypothetical protein [candidate division WOR-3 bacterium]
VPDFNAERDISIKIKDILAEQFDMNETDSYIWHDNDFLKQIQYNTTCSIELKNPVSSVNTLLRDSMLTTMLRFSLENLKFYDWFKLFDIGRIFPDNEEKEALGLVIINEKSKNGDKNTFLEMKKIVNTLFYGIYSQLPDYSPSGNNSLLKPGMTADIRFRDRACGIIGTLNPLHNKLFDKKVNAALCQIDIESFLRERKPAGFEQFSPYPISRIDFSIMKPDSMSFNSLSRIVEDFRDEFIKESEITAIYSGKGIDDGYKSVTYRFTLSSRDKTPDNDMLQSLREQFITYLKEHGLQLR